MRLIDAEHLKWNVSGIKCGTLTVAYLNWILEHEEPTVDAIPVEWLKQHYPIHGVYNTYQHFRSAYAVQEILDEWERVRKEE